MNEEKFWPCEHIGNDYGRSEWAMRNWNIRMPIESWKLCPICEAKRPTAPVKLAQILFEAWQEVYPSEYGWDKANEKVVRGCQAQAKVVVRMVQDLFLNAESWVSVKGKLEEML